MKQKLTMILAALFLCVGAALAQVEVRGTVVSSEDDQPIVGATVKVVGETKGVITDFDGRFTISVPKESSVLEFSYVGMETRTVKASRQAMHVVLSPDNAVLEEVIVQAFGTAKKSAFTGSAKVVGADELSKSQVTSVTNALQGAVPGVQLTSSNGAPGATSTIRIRGFSSITAGKDPLIIVDGAPYSGDISNINPNDVESMTVLKDAASNALYGARGANGVIMITTKNGKKGKPATVTFDAKYGGNTRALQHYDVIKDPAQYYEMQYQALNNYYKADRGMDANSAWLAANQALVGQVANGGLGYNIWTYPEGQMLIGSNGRLNPNATLGRVVKYKGEEYLWTPDDWEDVGTRTGARQEYNVSVTGSTDRANLYFSLGYLGNEGITYNSDLERLTGRMRADYQAKDWMKVGANLSYTRFNSNSLGNNGSDSSTSNIWAFTSQMAPIYPAFLRNADGSVKIDSNNIKMMDYGNGMNGNGQRPFIYDANPLQDVKLNTRQSEGNASTGNAFIDITPIEGLVLTLNATYNLDETRYTIVYNPYYGQFDTTGGTIEVEHSRAYNFNYQQLLNYTTTIAKHNNVNVMLGHEFYKQVSTALYASKSKMFSQDIKELNGAVVDGQSAGSYRLAYNNEGYFGRVQYDYDGRIFASASLRADASSRFDKDYQWGRFWSVGAAWLINKEKWFDVDWVNELKVKASYGSQGNDLIGYYLYTDSYDIVNSNGEIGTSFFRKGTRDITWETNNNTNIGVEFSLFNGKLSGGLEYYYRKTSDMLFSFSVAPSNGYSSYYDNVGDLYNTGVELDLNYNIFRKKNFNWDFHMNVGTLKNKITMIHPDKKTASFYDADGKRYDGYASGSFYIAEGLPMYSWRLKEYAGVCSQSDIDASNGALSQSDLGASMWWKNKYVQKQDKDENGELLWKLDDDKNPILDADGNKIPVMVDDDNADGNGHKVVTGRELTAKYAEGDYYINNKSTIPTLFGGFGTNISFYGFDFSINCSYSIGGYGYDGTYQTFMTNPTSSHAGYHFHKDLLNAWSESNLGSDIPRFNFADTYAAGTSDRFLTNASYLNIENINFGYTFPKKISRAAKIENLRVYLTCENVGYFSKRKGYDPRQAYDDWTSATNYSPMRTISGGVSITF